MLKGILKIANPEKMDLLHQGTLEILEKTGLQIRGDFLLKALADAGCKVDFKKHRAWFKPDVVERQISYQNGRYKMVRSSLWYPFCKEISKEDVAWPDDFIIDYGFGARSVYDYPSGEYRQPTIKDQIDMIKLGNALESVKAICAPFICSEFDPRIEIIESSRILLLNTKKPAWVGTSAVKEVRYLAELAKLVTNNDEYLLRTQPPIFVAAYCTTSPLKIDTRSCEVLEEALKYKFPVNFCPMPILGGTAPVTPAASAIIAAAEILGGITATSLIDPELYYYGTAITAEMDMITTNVCYATPASILTDVLLHQLFRYKYGIVLNVEPAYVEAKTPGIQASLMKLFRQMAFASTVSSSLPIGLLDNASTFSPTQAIIDYDINKALHQFSKGVEINRDTMCLDLIEDLEFCEQGNYLESEHTLNNFRDILWDSLIFDRTYRKNGTCKVQDMEESLLKKADQIWRDLVLSQKDIEVEPKFKREVDRIVEAARKELLL